jgi:hypothetical protein
MMTTDDRFDAAVSTWFEEAAPARLPGRVLDATFERTRRTRQETAWRILPGATRMPRFVSALGGAVVIVVAAALAFNVIGPIGPSGPTFSPGPTPTSPDVFTEIAPGAFVAMPDGPLGERTTPPMVWTGAELIVWGDGIYGLAGDGEAFDLANGTWRVIADAPLTPRSEAAVAWTGKEMLVWGGRVNDSFFYDGAAYNPVTDTWRRLPSAPAAFDGPDPRMVWTGTEAVVLSPGGAAAYNPATDQWRNVAQPPFEVLVSAWWTGDSIVVARAGYDPAVDSAARYDLAKDWWTMVDVGASAALVGVAGSDGRASAFINLPSVRGEPVHLIDSAGTLIEELPAFPGDPGVFGDVIGSSGQWVGDQALFEIWRDASDYAPEQLWALNPATKTWWRLDAGKPFPRVNDSAVAAGDLLLLWNRAGDVYQGPPTTPRVCCVAPPSKGGSIYRAGAPSASHVP